MTMSLKDSEGAWAKYTCVVPLVDMMNTGYPEEINTACRTTDDSKFVECLAIKDIKGGEEVFFFFFFPNGPRNLKMALRTDLEKLQFQWHC